jgi:hypothetical protein
MGIAMRGDGSTRQADLRTEAAKPISLGYVAKTSRSHDDGCRSPRSRPSFEHGSRDRSGGHVGHNPLDAAGDRGVDAGVIPLARPLNLPPQANLWVSSTIFGLALPTRTP